MRILYRYVICLRDLPKYRHRSTAQRLRRTRQSATLLSHSATRTKKKKHIEMSARVARLFVKISCLFKSESTRAAQTAQGASALVRQSSTTVMITTSSCRTALFLLFAPRVCASTRLLHDVSVRFVHFLSNERRKCKRPVSRISAFVYRF